MASTKGFEQWGNEPTDPSFEETFDRPKGAPVKGAPYEEFIVVDVELEAEGI